MNVQFVKYWRWFIRGSGESPGYRRLLNRWVVLHALVGICLAYIVETPLDESANTVLLPLTGIVIGLSFAWAGNAQGLLQTREMGRISEFRQGGYVEYIYLYQTAILVLLTAVVVWALAGLSVFDKRWPTPGRCVAYQTVEAFVFGLSSLSLQTCWNVVIGASYMLQMRYLIEKSENSQRSTENRTYDDKTSQSD